LTLRILWAVHLHKAEDSPHRSTVTLLLYFHGCN
jgi:hypothetical protein